MIVNDKELEVVQRQLRLAEKALASLRRDMQGRSRQQLELMAEPDIDMIRKLRAEIDEYLGIPAAAEPADGPAPPAPAPVA